MKARNAQTRRNALFIIGLLALAAIFTLIVTIVLNGQSPMVISLDATNVNYIVCHSRGAGPKRLDCLENQSVIDDLCNALSGEYDRIGKLNVRGRDGGAPSRICFYDNAGKEIATVYYQGGFVCAKGKVQGIYTMYQHRDHVLSFSNFENVMAQKGVLVR